MNIFTRILIELESLCHIHPSNETAIAIKKTQIAELATHPDVTPEQRTAIASLTQTAAKSVVIQVPEIPAAPIPAVPEPAPTVAADPVQPPTP